MAGYRRQDALDVFEHVVVPKPDNCVAAHLQPIGAARIGIGLLGVLPVIKFNDEFGIWAEEIDDIWSHRDLALEPRTVHLLTPHPRPRPLFRFGRVLT